MAILISPNAGGCGETLRARGKAGVFRVTVVDLDGDDCEQRLLKAKRL